MSRPLFAGVFAGLLLLTPFVSAEIPPPVCDEIAGPADLLDNHKQMQMVLVQCLRQKGLEAQREAAEKFRANQFDDVLAILQDYIDELDVKKLEPAQLAPLKRPVEQRLAQYRLLMSESKPDSGVGNSSIASLAILNAIRKAEELKRQKVDALWKEYNALYRVGRYLEAQRVALRVSELDPDNPVADSAVQMARRARAVKDAQIIRENKVSFWTSPDVFPGSAPAEQDRWGRASPRILDSPIESFWTAIMSIWASMIEESPSAPVAECDK